MRQISVILMFAFFLQTNHAQKIIFENAEKTFISLEKCDTIALTDLCVIYNQIIQKDSANREKVEESQMILQAGKNISKYSNYKKLISDSINRSVAVDNNLNAQQIQASLDRIHGSGDGVRIFKNYPNENKLYFCKHIGTFTAYEEDIPDFSWSVSDETSDMLGYECRKATCHFRGRDYTAWFAPEIPVSNGPWKFGGLPGLILKAEDSKGMFRFEAFSVFKPTWNMPITQTHLKNKIETTREKYNQAERRYVESPITILQNKPGIKLPEGSAEKAKLRPYNPIELE